MILANRGKGKRGMRAETPAPGRPDRRRLHENFRNVMEQWRPNFRVREP